MENEYLCFIKYVGKDIDDDNIYEFIFTNNTDDFFCENGEYKPCCLCDSITPIDSTYNIVKKVNMGDIKLDLIQESCCFSFGDCQDGIVALAYENMDTYDEYPEPLRIVLHYGMKYIEVEEILAKRNIIFENE